MANLDTPADEQPIAACLAASACALQGTLSSLDNVRSGARSSGEGARTWFRNASASFDGGPATIQMIIENRRSHAVRTPARRHSEGGWAPGTHSWSFKATK